MPLFFLCIKIVSLKFSDRYQNFLAGFAKTLRALQYRKYYTGIAIKRTGKLIKNSKAILFSV